jgi:hypothetical protein
MQRQAVDLPTPPLELAKLMVSKASPGIAGGAALRLCGCPADVHADRLSDRWQAIRGVPEKEIRSGLSVDSVSREMAVNGLISQ